MVVLTALAVASAGWELARRGLLRAARDAPPALPDVSVELNDRAWEIAISGDSSRELMEAALVLAERAVPRAADPNILDTLAEVQFALGRRDEAIETIDEAIVQAPHGAISASNAGVSRASGHRTIAPPPPCRSGAARRAELVAERRGPSLTRPGLTA